MGKKVFFYLLIVICSLLFVSGCENHWIRKITDHMYCGCGCDRQKENCDCCVEPVPLSDAKEITAFAFASPPAAGVINETAKTISVAVPSGTNVTSLEPVVTHTGASYSPTGAQNFTSPVAYTVTAADGSTQTYTVTVTVAAVTLTGITAEYDSTATVYTSTPLEDLRTGLTVTAHYSNGDSEMVDDYTLSGSLAAAGQRTITAAYSGRTATFTVTVTAVAVTGIRADYMGTSILTTDTNVDSLKNDLTVTAFNNDGTSGILSGTEYTLSGTLTAGTSSEITVTYGVHTAKFNVTVINPAVNLTGITASYAQAGTVFSSTYIDNLKNNLTVTAYFSDSSSIQLVAADYELSGTLAVGTNITITVTYSGQTASFTVDEITAVGIPGLDVTLNANGTYTITGSPDAAGDIVIPGWIDGIQVTTIAADAFRNNANITSVVIEEGVTSIGGYAFRSCRNLTDITIPSSVTSIGIYVFAYCASLTDITIPLGVTYIGNQAFTMSGLTSITINPGITTIGAWVFSYTNLTDITIPSSVTSIGTGAFVQSNLTEITIPSSVTSIGSQAFERCAGLTSVTMLRETPPTLANINAFDRTHADLVIYVPAGSVDAYRTAARWSDFADRIQAIP